MHEVPPIAIDRIGPLAARFLSERAWGEVGAVFEHSFYVSLRGHWICLLPSGFGNGPLNVLYDTGQHPRARARLGDTVAVANKTVRVGTSVTFSFAAAELWSPPSVASSDSTTLARGLAELGAVVRTYPVPQESLAACWLTPCEMPSRLGLVASAACRPLRHLRDVLARSISAGGVRDLDIGPVLPLIGLGGGLTPSGDDALGGAMIALHCIGCDRLRDAFWSRLQASAATATGPISYAHLEAAAQGYGHEALHGTLNALLAGRAGDMRANLAAIDAIGHTSGWDGLAGAVLALQARTAAAANDPWQPRGEPEAEKPHAIRQ
jgi:hypothetical protein